jgi:hypothetical protein
MTSVTVWRSEVRSRIDGWQYHFDGVGSKECLHATVFQTPCNGRREWKCEVLEESQDRSRAEAYTYGDTLPLTYKMAKEIAARFVAGKKIPKRLEWR